MTTQSNFRSKTMSRAWAIYHETGEQFSVCLSRAWAAYRLIKNMTKGKVSFSFKKKDGSLRKAVGTLSGINYTPSAREIKEHFKSISYFDVEKQAWRSFKTQNLISQI